MKKLPALKRTAPTTPLPPATATAPREAVTEASLMIEVPTQTMRDLRVQAAMRGVTIRSLVLQALKAAGVAVDDSALRDRRRSK